MHHCHNNEWEGSLRNQRFANKTYWLEICPIIQIFGRYLRNQIIVLLLGGIANMPTEWHDFWKQTLVFQGE